jgi:putative addiction module component (TIGR02574 family)
MAPNTLTELLKLPPGDRAELAMALWASLDDASRGTELALTPEQIAELDRRFAEHQANPDSARSWHDVENKLRDRR